MGHSPGRLNGIENVERKQHRGSFRWSGPLARQVRLISHNEPRGNIISTPHHQLIRNLIVHPTQAGVYDDFYYFPPTAHRKRCDDSAKCSAKKQRLGNITELKTRLSGLSRIHMGWLGSRSNRRFAGSVQNRMISRANTIQSTE